MRVIFYCDLSFFITLNVIFIPKYTISTALIIENPVRSPMVPPIADSMSTNFAALSYNEYIHVIQTQLISTRL